MLAIVIPYYKINFFEATLASLAAQTNMQFKVYIGDDASTNDPKMILDKYQGQFDFVYHRFEQNLGGFSLTQQWERCVRLCAEEEWVMLLCDDDVLATNCVFEFYKNSEVIDEHSINVVRFATDVIDEQGIAFNNICNHPKFEKATDFFIRRISGGTRNSLSENIFRRKIMIDKGFREFSLAWHSDDMALLDFSNFGLLYTLNDALVFFRLSSLNITNRQDNLLLKNKASFQFYYYLIKEHYNRFNLIQIKLIQKKLEKQLLNDKKNVKYWVNIIVLYCGKLNFKDLIKLFFLAFKSLLK